MNKPNALIICPKCRIELMYNDEPQDYLYCPHCVDVAYELDGSFKGYIRDDDPNEDR